MDLGAGAPVRAAFDGLSTVDITPFLVLRATNPEELTGGTVIQADLLGDPAGRLDEVLARQVDTMEKFLRFLALLLGLADGAVLAGAMGGVDRAACGPFGSNAGIFELVVQGLADQPETIVSIDRLVASLRLTDSGRQVLPDGFADLWAVVSDAHQRLTRRSAKR